MGKQSNHKRAILASVRFMSEGGSMETSDRKIRRAQFRKDNGGNQFSLELKGQTKFIKRLY